MESHVFKSHVDPRGRLGMPAGARVTRRVNIGENPYGMSEGLSCVLRTVRRKTITGEDGPI